MMDDEFLNDYLEEAKDILGRTSQLMDELDSRPPTSEDIDELFRSIHTIKGGAGMFGWTHTQDAGHSLESYLGQCKSNIAQFDLNFVRESVDTIETLLESNDRPSEQPPSVAPKDSSEGESSSQSLSSHFFSGFFEIFAEIVGPEINKGTDFFEFEIPKDDKESFVQKIENAGAEKYSEEESEEKARLLFAIPLDQKEKAQNLLLELSQNPSFHPITSLLDEGTKSEVPSSEEIESPSPLETKTSERQTSTTKSDVLRVPLKKVNNALNSTWEIFLLRNQIAYLFEKNKPFLNQNMDMVQEWEVLDNALRRNIAELESTVMSMRMNDLSSLFSRMKKVVRGYQKAAHKNIRFTTRGDDIELDKKVIDMLGEPLIHLVRNAMDHGIETSTQRLEKGKSPEGMITLSAKSLSDKVVLKIEDDGKGINPSIILEKAKEKGIEVSHINSDEEAVHLIFSPGFSTAEQVTDVSGRGVGMDAVKKSIKKLGGEIYIETEVDKGSIFIIELPLSMSVVSAILFEVNGKSYGSSINNLVEICREPQKVLEENNGEVLFPYRGEFLECYDLRDFFTDNLNENNHEVPEATFCIMDINNKRVAIRVDKVFKHTDIVVKETTGIFPNIDSITGVSILATGEPIFIVSLTKIYRNFKDNWRSHAS